MTREEVYQRFHQGFRELLDDESIELHDETVAVDERFAFKIPMGNVVTTKNVGEMADIILGMGF